MTPNHIRVRSAFQRISAQTLTLEVNPYLMVGLAINSPIAFVQRALWRYIENHKEGSFQAIWHYLEHPNLDWNDPVVREFRRVYQETETRLINEFVNLFCTPDGQIDWIKVVKFNSGE